LRLTTEESSNIIAKFLEHLPSVKSQALPPFIYQLITLASSCKQLDRTLCGVIKYFNKLDAMASKNDASVMDGK